MKIKTNQNTQNYKKIEPVCRNNNHMCRCHCHNKIKNNRDNHLILEEKNLVLNCDKTSNINVIKTETNNNLIKSFVIYKNQIKPLFVSKISKNSSNKSHSNIKKYSYGGNTLKIATITNNHSYKEIFGSSSSKDKIFKKSRVINYNTENNNEYNFEYGCNNNKKQNNINIIKDIKINNDRFKKCPSQNELNIKTYEINNYNKEKKYNEFIRDLNSKLNNNSEIEKYSLKNETETNIDNKNKYNNLTNNNKNFRYYFDYKKNMIEKKKNLLNSNKYMNIKTNSQVNDEYEDIKLKIKLGLMKKNKNNNENIKKNRMDVNYIILEKTKKILEEKNKKFEKKLNKKDRNNNIKENNTLGKLKNLIENNNINKYFFSEKN